VVHGWPHRSTEKRVGDGWPAPPSDTEMNNPLDNPEVAKQVMEADKRDYTVPTRPVCASPRAPGILCS
jgi:hypothetical protein